MTRRLAVILLFTIPFVTGEIFAQDPAFSQFYANPLYLNPALAGVTLNPRLIANYRNQWPGMGKAFNTYNFSYDQYVGFLHGGVGLLVTADRAGGGTLNTTMISLSYAYKFNITSRLQASGAIRVGLYQRSLNWDKLQFASSSSEPPPEFTTNLVPDFSAGIFMAYDEFIYGGFAMDHLTQPNIGFSSSTNDQLYMKYTAHIGSVINLNKNGGADGDREFSLSPNILYQQQFQFHQLNIGLYLTIDPFVGGLWFRHNFENADALIPMLGFHYKGLRVAYSYDYTLSRLINISGGAHEVSVSWQFAVAEKSRRIKAIKCPRF
jgi:type IX secretion system PorP/SprF family membrane protein